MIRQYFTFFVSLVVIYQSLLFFNYNSKNSNPNPSDWFSTGVDTQSAPSEKNQNSQGLQSSKSNTIYKLEQTWDSSNIHQENNKKPTHETNFMVLGDFGYINESDPHSEQTALGLLMEKTARKLDYDFIVSVGDNFYPFGLDNDTDPRADVVFEDTFKMSSLNLDWYSVLGNHDLMGDMSAALILNQRFPLWKQTEPYFSKIVNIGDSKFKTAFVYLHSCDLVCIKPTSPECYNGTKKNVRFDQIQTQIDWLSDSLASFSEDDSIIWKVVVIHNAIFSAGERHGDNQELIKTVLPILSKYKVDVVLSGHDHSVQYLRSHIDQSQIDDSGQNGFEKGDGLDFDVDCLDMPDYNYCSTSEFFHFELSRCGVVTPISQMSQALKSGGRFVHSNYRETIIPQHQYINQFVLGNGGIKHEKICPVSQMESQGKLRYAHSVSGIADIKITKDGLDINLVSVEDKLLYSVKIVRNLENF